MATEKQVNVADIQGIRLVADRSGQYPVQWSKSDPPTTGTILVGTMDQLTELAYVIHQLTVERGEGSIESTLRDIETRIRGIR